jgi:hypothetical protein
MTSWKSQPDSGRSSIQMPRYPSDSADKQPAGLSPSPIAENIVGGSQDTAPRVQQTGRISSVTITFVRNDAY